MERAHRHALEELQRKHQRQTSEMQREKERLLSEETQATAREEIRRMRSFVTGQRSEVILDSNQGRSVCELEVLLRVKHNEVEYLHKEIMCLRNEVQFLNTEKQSVCVQYQDVCEELKVMKERSEREVQTLREHLRLAIAALQEERGLHNSI
ncbi:hypothetical protein PDJAM_G00175500 [Pangasius djambal]|uniref:Uncharacterized protein n=1 Tax=Pangasius djambal TaxID=1691987 RepID=A0ACC5ZP67_9TELE|nr:hypothetical protein [Pangasius djambal]